MELSWIDIGILVVLLISIIVAILRGFVREAVALGSWVVAILLAIAFSGWATSYLPDDIHQATLNIPGVNWLGLSMGIAFLLILVGTLIAGALLNYILGKITERSLLGIGAILAIFLGIARGTVLTVLIILAASLTSLPHSDAWNSSRLLPPFESIAHKVIDMLPLGYSRYFSLGENER